MTTEEIKSILLGKVGSAVSPEVSVDNLLKVSNILQETVKELEDKYPWIPKIKVGGLDPKIVSTINELKKHTDAKSSEISKLIESNAKLIEIIESISRLLAELRNETI